MRCAKHLGFEHSSAASSEQRAALALAFLASLERGLRFLVVFPGRDGHRGIVDARLNPFAQFAHGRRVMPSVSRFSRRILDRLFLEFVVEARDERGMSGVHAAVAEGGLTS